MGRKKTKELKRDGMDILSKILFALIFFSMGFAIIGAGLRGQPATAPIVITIGMMMNLIAVAPFYVPLLYKHLVPEDASSTT